MNVTSVKLLKKLVLKHKKHEFFYFPRKKAVFLKADIFLDTESKETLSVKLVNTWQVKVSIIY